MLSTQNSFLSKLKTDNLLTISVCKTFSYLLFVRYIFAGPGGSMSLVVGFPNNPYNKPITNTAWGPARLCKLQKGCTRLGAASDKDYQLLAHGRWFSPASFTTKTGRHGITEILLKVALKHQKLIEIYLITF